jgi:uncharacterized protein YgbK (DUF1537 family)
VVIIVTSLQETARQQAAAVAAAGAARFEPAADDLLDDSAWARWSGRVIEELQHIPFALLLIGPVDRARNLPAELIPRRFAGLTARLFAAADIAGVIVTGGDGARALVDAVNATGLKLRDEVVTGMPIGNLTGGCADGLSVVTKAGSFGGTDALIQAVDALRSGRYS